MWAFFLKHNIYTSFILCYLALNKIPPQSTFHFGFCFIILTESTEGSQNTWENATTFDFTHTHRHRQSSHTVAYVMVQVFFNDKKMIKGHFCIDLWQNLRPGTLQRLFLNSYFCCSLRFIYLSIYSFFQLLFAQYQKSWRGLSRSKVH